MKMVFSRKQLGIPYALFLILFVVAPLFVIIYYAFTNGSGQFTISNLTDFFTNPNTLGTLCYSFVLAFTTTCVCLLIAYPVAYILARSEWKAKSIILMVLNWIKEWNIINLQKNILREIKMLMTL